MSRDTVHKRLGTSFTSVQSRDDSTPQNDRFTASCKDDRRARVAARPRGGDRPRGRQRCAHKHGVYRLPVTSTSHRRRAAASEPPRWCRFEPGRSPPRIYSLASTVVELLPPAGPTTPAATAARRKRCQPALHRSRCGRGQPGVALPRRNTDVRIEMPCETRLSARSGHRRELIQQAQHARAVDAAAQFPPHGPPSIRIFDRCGPRPMAHGSTSARSAPVAPRTIAQIDLASAHPSPPCPPARLRQRSLPHGLEHELGQQE